MSSGQVVEVIFEIDFSSRDEDISSTLLEMFSSEIFKKRFPARKRLPTAGIPLAIRRETPEFKYQPEFMLRGDGEALLIGSQMFAFSVRGSCSDEGKFIAQSAELVENIAGQKDKVDVERVAYRGVGLIESHKDTGTGFDQIHFQGKVAGYDLPEHDMLVKFQVKDENGMLHTIQVKNNTTLINNSTNERMFGLLIDIFTGRDFGLDELWSDSAEVVGQLRAAEGSMFEKVMKKNAMEMRETKV